MPQNYLFRKLNIKLNLRSKNKLASYILLLFCISLFKTQTGFSQTASITGTAFDSTNNKPLINSVVILNRATDSVMAKFVRTGLNGKFIINNIKTGKYEIMLTFPEYADYVDTFTLLPGENKNLGGLNMLKLSQVMQSIIIKAYRGAVRIKGDTTEFVADSFKTREGANIEELLKKLPGVQVDRKGKIIAQGKEVQKVLVDGEEFFGDDPTVATKNLDAKSVDVVQVYDTKSDNSIATGVDDGTSVKVLDIKLKDANKKGFFGNVSAGHDLTNIYEGRAMINAFTDKRKISAFTLGVNSPNVGLNWGERDDYGTAVNNNYDEESGSSYYYSSNDDFEYYLNYTAGLPTSRDFGTNYNNKFLNKKWLLNSSYSYKSLILNSNEKTNTTTVTNERVIRQQSDETVLNNRSRHSGRIKNEWKIDSLTVFKLTVDASTTAINTNTLYNQNSNYGDGIKLNNQNRTVDLNGSNNNIEINSSLNHRSNIKKGRFYNFSYSGEIDKKLSTTYIQSTNELFFDSGSSSNLQNITQRKLVDQFSSSHSLNALYNEPLNKRWSLAFSASQKLNDNLSTKSTFNNELVNQNFIDSLSSNSDYHVGVSSAGLILKYKRKKISFSVQNFINRTVLSQTEELRNYNYSKPYINFLPGANFSYSRSKQSSIRLSYNLSNRQPQIQQIQPLIDNTNPLYLQIGNPNLKQSINHNFNLNLNDGKVLKNRWMWGSIWGSVTQHEISNRTYIDSFGKTISQAVNVEGNYNFGAYSGYYKTLGKLPISLSLNYQPRISRQKTLINNLDGFTNTQTHSASTALEFEFGDFGDMRLEFQHTQNYSKNTLNSLKNKNWTQQLSVSFSFNLPKGFSITANMDANRRQKTEIYKSNVNNTLITSEIAKTFFKDKRLLLSLGVYDLLNQNIGYNRNVYNNVISENTFNTFNQFFYGKLVYKFKNKIKESKKEEIK